MNHDEASRVAPDMPRCFPERDKWVDYLLQCQQSSKRQTEQPFRKGVFRPKFNFCADCTTQHGNLMKKAERCDPSVFLGATEEVPLPTPRIASRRIPQFS